MVKQAQEGSRRSKLVQEGFERFSKVTKGQEWSIRSRRIKKCQEGSRRFQRFQEVLRRLLKVIKGSGIL